jgi:predicted esterase
LPTGSYYVLGCYESSAGVESWSGREAIDDSRTLLRVHGWKQMLSETEVLPWSRLGDLPCGKVWRLSFFSPALGLRRFVGVYRTSGAPLPRFCPSIVYLFRGHFSEWFYAQEDGSRERHGDGEPSTLVELIQSAVDREELPPCLLVFPDFGGDSRNGLTLAIDWKSPDLARRGLFLGGGLGAFETSFRAEFLPRLEEALGLINPRRAAVGFSLGGLNAVQLSLRNPSLFSTVAAYDGSFPYHPVAEDDRILKHPLFDPIFGRPADPAHLKAHSPAWLARNLPPAQLRKMRFFLASGPESSEPDDSNFYRTKAVVDALAAQGVRNEMDMVKEHGRHDWFTADNFAFEVLTRVWGNKTED